MSNPLCRVSVIFICLFLLGCTTGQPRALQASDFHQVQPLGQIVNHSDAQISSSAVRSGIVHDAVEDPSTAVSVLLNEDEFHERVAGSILLDVPFAPQAPFADWNDPRQQEGCEEMSAIMVHHYWQGLPLSREQALAELQEFSDWQTARGLPLDISVRELADNVRLRYGYDVTVDTDVTLQAIRQYLLAGVPVIVPAAGRMLRNPYFSGDGPWYHMLVIVGFDDSEFITNDPGTKRGQRYRYPHQVLLEAVHDWTGVKEEIQQGEKAMLIIQPKNHSAVHATQED